MTEYLNQRLCSNCGSSRSPSQDCGKANISERLRDLAHTIYHRTDGNPLFMVNVVDYLLERGAIDTFIDAAHVHSAETLRQDNIDTPPSIVQMIEGNLERLHPDEQTFLEAASVTGFAFPSAAVAAALERSIDEIEAVFVRLTRQCHFVEATGTAELPDGTVTAIFRFVHGLYRDVLYDRVPSARRVELHRRIAQRGEQAYGEHVGDVAVELAYHYRRCGNNTKAIQYLELAGERTAARRAYHEAEQHYRNAIITLDSLPDSPEHLSQKISLLLRLGNIMGATRGFSAAETANAYGRARSLAERAGSGDSIPILYAQTTAAISQGELQAAAAISREILTIAERIGSSWGLFLAHVAYGSGSYFHGNLIEARDHLATATEYYRVDHDLRGIAHAPAVTHLLMCGVTEWYLGYPNRALQCMNEALALANHMADPISLCIAQYSASVVHQLNADWPQMVEASEETLRLSLACQFPLMTAVARIQVAYSHARTGQTNGSGAAEAIQQALLELNTVKYFSTRGWLLGLLAQIYLLEGKVAEAMESIEQGLGFTAEQLVFRPELLRLRGEVTLSSGSAGKALFELAEADFRAAIARTRAMSAKSDELRATSSLARLLRKRSSRRSAHDPHEYLQLVHRRIRHW